MQYKFGTYLLATYLVTYCYSLLKRVFLVLLGSVFVLVLVLVLCLGLEYPGLVNKTAIRCRVNSDKVGHRVKWDT